MIYTEKLKELDFWKRTINNQLNRYDSECSTVSTRSMTDEEIAKYQK
jgi:hypothetical protein